MTDPRSVARRAGLILLFMLACPAIAAGPTDLSISMPLGPHFRPGKYVPVRLAGSFTQDANYWVAAVSANVRRRDDIPRGAGRTSVNLRQGRLDVVVPWMVIDRSAKRPRLAIESFEESAEGQDLVELPETRRLVGYTVSFPPELAAELLPAAWRSRAPAEQPEILPVPLDPALPIKGHPCAYEILDAIVLDQASAARLAPTDIPNLLACGVAVAIQTATPPLPNWPWRRVGEFSVLRHDAAGPLTAGYHPDAYAPVADWQSGWPWPFRRRVLLLAGLCCVLLLALALWRPPLVALWAAMLLVGLIGIIGKWWNVHVAIQQAAGEVIVVPSAPLQLTQTDAWTYQTASAPRTATLRWNDVTHAVYATDAGVNDTWITLNCDTTGRPTEFFAHIQPNRKLAFLSRSVGPASPKTPPAQPITSPLKGIAETLYVTEPGAKVRGQFPTSPPSQPAFGYVEVQQWPAVVVKR